MFFLYKYFILRRDNHHFNIISLFMFKKIENKFETDVIYEKLGIFLTEMSDKRLK